ncbi:unnamed protein product, partial [Rotaria sp. Silwood1]
NVQQTNTPYTTTASLSSTQSTITHTSSIAKKKAEKTNKVKVYTCC